MARSPAEVTEVAVRVGVAKASLVSADFKFV